MAHGLGGVLWVAGTLIRVASAATAVGLGAAGAEYLRHKAVPQVILDQYGWAATDSAEMACVTFARGVGRSDVRAAGWTSAGPCGVVRVFP